MFSSDNDGDLEREFTTFDNHSYFLKYKTSYFGTTKSQLLGTNRIEVGVVASVL